LFLILLQGIFAIIRISNPDNLFPGYNSQAVAAASAAAAAADEAAAENATNAV
jgi:hypothetical protein